MIRNEVEEEVYVQKYIVYWTWKFSDTEEGIELYNEMENLKKTDDDNALEVAKKIGFEELSETEFKELSEDDKNTYIGNRFTILSEKRYPTSLASSYGTSPNWFTIFEATDDQLHNWLNHYESVLKVIDIKPIMSADEFIDKWENNEINWRYWFE